MSIRERRVAWHPKTNQICQIPKEGIEYALVSEDYRQIHQLIWCKDFIQDAIYGHINQKLVEIYGFQYDPKICPPVYMKQLQLMVTNWKDENFASKIFENCQSFLHEIESRLKIKKTVIEKCCNPPARYRKAGVFLLNGSKRWMHAPPMVSLYTLLIRVGLVHPKGQEALETIDQVKNGILKPYNWQPAKDSDSDVIINAYAGIKRILSNGDRRLFYRDIKRNYPANNYQGVPFSVFQMHDHCGMIGFSTARNKEDFPRWHKLDNTGA